MKNFHVTTLLSPSQVGQQLFCLSLSLVIFLACCVFAGRARGVEGEANLPPFDRLLVEINGNRSLIDSSSEVVVVRGDLVIFIEGWASNSSQGTVDEVDLVGYSSKTRKTGKNDKGFVINTATDLQDSFALDSSKDRFNVRGYSGKKAVANSILKIISARLDGVEISLNGSKRSIRDGEELQLSSTDRIAVLSVRTNIRGNENVTHELREVQAKGAAIKSDKKELVFARSGQVFGRIPIKWRE